jgi:hypothetical protein
LNHSEPESARIDEFLERRAAFVILAVFRGSFLSIFAAADLYRPDYRCHVVCPFALTPGATANQAFINLNRMLASNTVTLGPNHAGTELVKDLEGSFITRKPELALELKRGLAGCLGRHQITSPKPD